VYSTFLNRAFDQVLMDVGMHKLGVTFVLDRAGVTGPDGASHNGIWDVSVFGVVPGLRLAAPRDAQRLRDALAVAVETEDAPTVIRYSKDRIPDPIACVSTHDDIDVLLHSESDDVLIVGYGEMVGTALGVAKALADQGIGATVVDPVWALPVSESLVRLTRDYRFVVTIEDNLITGGLGSQLELAMDSAGIETPMRQFGVPKQFLTPGTRKQVLERIGLTAKQIAPEVLHSWFELESDPLTPDLKETLI
jgi:1-deoxy-D-xylulose-5-phosphate synthase